MSCREHCDSVRADPERAPQKRSPTLEHLRDLWTLHSIQSTCTAALYRTTFGIELRVEHGRELIESRLSRYGEAPLLLIAEEMKANLIEKGWTDRVTESRAIVRSFPSNF